VRRGRRTSAQIENLLQPPFTTRQGRFRYRDFVQTLRVFDADETQKHQQAIRPADL
jgi:hypothetical protein